MRAHKPKIVDLFAGVGGLSLGAARAGFDVCGAVDNDAHALRGHKTNFTASRHLDVDVSTLAGQELIDLLGLETQELSGIVGGPPCQGFSSMGRRNRDDPRNNLFVDFFRIVSEVNPAFYLAENVPGILRPANSSVVDSALAFVTSKYTVLEPMRLSAQDYGAPTARKRVFFFGYDPDRVELLTDNDFLPPSDVEKVVVRNALNGLVVNVKPNWQKESDGWRISRSNGKSAYASRLHGHVPDGVGDAVALRRLRTESKSSGNLGTAHTPEVAKRYDALKPGQQDRVSKSKRLNPDGFCPTLRAGTGPDFGSYQAVRPIHPIQPRVITPREAARLQGFPDWFTFSPTKWHSFRQIGSSVSPILAESLMTRVLFAIQDQG